MVSYDEIVKVTDDFRNAIKQLDSVQSQLEMIITDSDKAFGDVRHFIEFKDCAFTRHEKSVLCKALKEASETRRKAKVTKEVLTPIFEYINSHKSFISDIGRLANDLKKAKEKAEKPHAYKVRVLQDLFGDDIFDGDVKLQETKSNS